MRLNFFVLIFVCSTIYAQQKPDSILFNQMVKRIKFVEQHHLDSAKNLAKSLITQAKKANNKPYLAKGHIRLASVYSLLGKPDSALESAKKAQNLRYEINDFEGLVSVFMLKNYLFEEAGKLDSAFTQLYLAEKVAQKHNLIHKLSGIYLAIAKLHLNNNQSQKAFQNIEQSKNIAAQLNDTSSLVYIHLTLGDYYFNLTDYNSAIKEYLEAEKRLNQPNSLSQNAQNLNNLAACYAALNNFNTAIQFYKKALKTFAQINMPNQMALIHFNLGTLFYNFNKADSSIVHFQQSIQLAQKTNNLTRLVNATEYLIEAQALKGNYFQAYQTYLTFSMLNDSLQKMHQIKAIAEMQTKFETHKKQQQITLLTAQNKIKTAQSNFLILVVVLLIITLLLVSYFFITKKKLAAQKEKLMKQEIDSLLSQFELKTYNALIKGQEEERQRISSELHDRLGSMLSTIKLLFSSLEEKLNITQTENQQKLEKTNKLIDEACVEVRRISHNLGVGMVAGFGLENATNELLESIQATGKITCKYSSFNFPNKIDLSTQIELFRVIQESVNNALKHAKASLISIQFTGNEIDLNIIIEDNGIGFNTNDENFKSGLGLNSMTERVNKLNGQIHFDSKIGRGTTIILNIPIKTSDY